MKVSLHVDAPLVITSIVSTAVVVEPLVTALGKVVGCAAWFNKDIQPTFCHFFTGTETLADSAPSQNLG